MECGKFILSGEDKKTLSCIKHTLAANGHIFIGYAKDSLNILRHIRNNSPDFVVVDLPGGLKDVRQTLEIIDEEILTACILVLDTRNEEVLRFLRESRAMSYITKPLYDEIVLQIVDTALMNFRRIREYEEKVRKLNDTLENRKIIEKAKWILVEKEGYTEAEAYEAIRKKSRDNRLAMREIAEAIILARG